MAGRVVECLRRRNDGGQTLGDMHSLARAIVRAFEIASAVTGVRSRALPAHPLAGRRFVFRLTDRPLYALGLRPVVCRRVSAPVGAGVDEAIRQFARRRGRLARGARAGSADHSTPSSDAAPRAARVIPPGDRRL